MRGTVTDASLRAVLAHIASSAWPADLVAVTGDLIQDDSRGAYDRFREHFTPMGLPVLCVPGNHDVRPMMKEALSAEPYRYCGAIERDDWLIAGIDSCIEDSAAGCVGDDELARLERLISGSAAKHVLVCLHHPPLPMGSKWLDSVGLMNDDRFLGVIAGQAKVRGAVFGHVHQAFDGMHGSIRIIGTPSTCRQFKKASDDFALDDNPPAYRRISLHSDGSIESELIWID